MLKVLTPEEVIENREKLLDDLEDALLGNPADWPNEFPPNFELANTIRHIFEFWQRSGK